MPETSTSKTQSTFARRGACYPCRQRRRVVAAVGLCLLLAFAGAESRGQTSLPQSPTVGGASSLTGGTPTLRTHPQAPGGSMISSVPDDFSMVTLAPGTLLDMQVYDMPEISGQLRVDKDGDVNVPMAGPVHVDGIPLTQARSLIEGKLKDAQILKNPQINLDIAQYSATNVTVLGEVQSPGRVQMLAPHSLSDVLAMVGGETITAGATIEIRHTVDGRMVTQKVDYARSKNTPAAEDIVVRPGDTVTVPRAGIVYVLGAVNRPGGYVMQEDGLLNVAQALALAYGTQMNAAIGGIRIVHKNSDGTLTETPVAFRKITSGKATAPMLQAEDIVYVPVSKGKTILSASLGLITSTSSALIYSSR